MSAQNVFQERLANDIHRIMRHIRGSEENPTVLDGTITLTIQDGLLVGVVFPEPAAPALSDDSAVDIITEQGIETYTATTPYEDIADVSEAEQPKKSTRGKK